MILQHNKHIIDARTIGGFFREALFQGRGITLLLGDQKFDLEIISLEEQSSRDRGVERMLVLKTRTGSVPLSALLNSSLWKCTFPKFIASWGSTPIYIDGDTIKTPLPAELEVANHRNGLRLDWFKKKSSAGKVTIQSDGVHALALFTLENLSISGAGGTLQVLGQVPVRAGAQLCGLIDNAGARIPLYATIVQAEVLPGEQIGDDVFYRIGLALGRPEELVDSAQSTVDSKERRRGKRRETQWAALLTSPMNPDHQIRVKVDTLSITGFRGTLADPADAALLPLGLQIALNDPEIELATVAFNGAEYKFQVVTDQDAALLSWLKRIDFITRDGIQSGVASGSELVDLFCESGAFSSEYLREQKSLNITLEQGLSKDTARQGWAHKWIEKNSSGNVCGHLSAVRFSDSSWHIGDLAGSIDPDRKISKEFISHFLSSFREYLAACRPSPRALMTWVEGHPYWVRFERYLKPFEGTPMLHRVASRYFRFKREGGREWATRMKLKPVLASDYTLINEVIDKVQDPAQQSFLRALDFCVESFGLPRVREAVLASKDSFRRDYYLLLNYFGNATHLIVAQRFPHGSSPHRTLDVPWIFCLDPLATPITAPSDLLELQLLLAKVGHEPPGILEISSLNNAVTGVSSKRLIWSLAHPSCFEFFEKKPAKEAA